jgi:hypothetical protein
LGKGSEAAKHLDRSGDLAYKVRSAFEPAP